MIANPRIHQGLAMHHSHARTLLIGLIACLPTTAFAGAPEELKKLQGAWVLVSETADGIEKPAAELRGIKLVFAGDGAWRVEKDGKVVGSGGMTLGPDKTPKTVDYTFTSGELKGQQFNAIYDVSGNTFRHCGVMNGARPDDFTAKAGSKRFSVVFHRSVIATPTAGRYLEVVYPPSDKKGELQFGVTYTLWIPPDVKTIRGVIVHQHGCGAGACIGGATAAYDLHWQALAKKWHCALLGPSYHQEDKQNCRLWCDPRNGSETTFLKALDEFATESGHAELKSAPWCVWGHSGGGFWASLMQTMHPERIVAIWFRSGTAFSAWEKGEIPRPEIPAAAYQIPIVLNPGAKEKDDRRFAGAWTGSMNMFKAYRAKGAPAAFAPDPRTAHECGDARYLAIPFFDACLELRLPKSGGKLKPIDLAGGKVVNPDLEDSGYASWLPNQKTVAAFLEYCKTGAVADATRPLPPRDVKLKRLENGTVELTWDADADFESGLRGFIVQRDGKELAKLPEKGIGRFGRALFQTMSYHDTPELPLPEMRFLDKTAAPGANHDYQVIAVNGVGLKSGPVKVALP
jgi:uncharacterized protein (TIGR03067 family)